MGITYDYTTDTSLQIFKIIILIQQMNYLVVEIIILMPILLKHHVSFIMNSINNKHLYIFLVFGRCFWFLFLALSALRPLPTTYDFQPSLPISSSLSSLPFPSLLPSSASTESCTLPNYSHSRYHRFFVSPSALSIGATRLLRFELKRSQPQRCSSRRRRDRSPIWTLRVHRKTS